MNLASISQRKERLYSLWLYSLWLYTHSGYTNCYDLASISYRKERPLRSPKVEGGTKLTPFCTGSVRLRGRGQGQRQG